mgnify:FL=1
MKDSAVHPSPPINHKTPFQFNLLQSIFWNAASMAVLGPYFFGMPFLTKRKNGLVGCPACFLYLWLWLFVLMFVVAAFLTMVQQKNLYS